MAFSPRSRRSPDHSMTCCGRRRTGRGHAQVRVVLLSRPRPRPWRARRLPARGPDRRRKADSPHQCCAGTYDRPAGRGATTPARPPGACSCRAHRARQGRRDASCAASPVRCSPQTERRHVRLARRPGPRLRSIASPWRVTWISRAFSRRTERLRSALLHLDLARPQDAARAMHRRESPTSFCVSITTLRTPTRARIMLLRAGRAEASQPLRRQLST